MTMLAVAEASPHRLGDEPTLASAVGALWEELEAGRAVTCPVCDGEMQPLYAQHARPRAGRCPDCGARLS